MMRPVKSRNGNSLTAKKAEPPWRARTVISVFSFTGICREKNAEEMKTEIHLVFCVLAVLPYLQQTEGQSSAEPLVRSSTAPLSHAGTSATPDLTKDPGGEVPQRTHNLAGGNETSTGAAAVTEAEAALPSETVTDEVFQASTPHVTASVATSAPTGTVSPSAAADSLSSTPRAQSTTPLQRVSTTEGHTREPLITFSSQTTHPVQDTGSTAPSTAQPQSESMTTASTQTTGHPLTSAAGWGPAGPTHREVPSELNVGDEDLKGPHYRSSSPLDPLLAGLLSVFIITTAIVFVVLFLKFRQRTNNPEFHRLQDLPMDDLMEDTPLSRYTY